MNGVHLVGRIASAINVEQISTRLGLRPRASFLVAVRRPVRSAGEPEWIRVETWGLQADNLVKYCAKGHLVAIDGHLRGHFSSPDDRTRGGRLRLVVVADAVTYLQRRSDADPDERDPDEGIGDE